MFRPNATLTPRKVLRLLNHLDEWSWTVASLAGGREWRGWGADRALLADLWDLTAAANTDKRNKPKYPRPSDTPRSVGRVADLPGAVIMDE